MISIAGCQEMVKVSIVFTCTARSAEIAVLIAAVKRPINRKPDIDEESRQSVLRSCSSFKEAIGRNSVSDLRFGGSASYLNAARTSSIVFESVGFGKFDATYAVHMLRKYEVRGASSVPKSVDSRSTHERPINPCRLAAICIAASSSEAPSSGYYIGSSSVCQGRPGSTEASALTQRWRFLIRLYQARSRQINPSTRQLHYISLLHTTLFKQMLFALP